MEGNFGNHNEIVKIGGYKYKYKVIDIPITGHGGP
jgi:hypothetical protein